MIHQTRDCEWEYTSWIAASAITHLKLSAITALTVLNISTRWRSSSTHGSPESSWNTYHILTVDSLSSQQWINTGYTAWRQLTCVHKTITIRQKYHSHHVKMIYFLYSTPKYTVVTSISKVWYLGESNTQLYEVRYQLEVHLIGRTYSQLLSSKSNQIDLMNHII